MFYPPKAPAGSSEARSNHIMIETYSDYIDRYLCRSHLGGRPSPGEHHFVSAYLVPKLYEINQRVPEYINPDGTKGIIGDVVYYDDHEHQFGIEVKLEIVRLTKGEFNDWIVNQDSAIWPHTFVGIGTSGISVCSWNKFREVYIAAVKNEKEGWSPQEIPSGYGPTKAINILLPLLGKGIFFRRGKSSEESLKLESSFLEALANELVA